MYTAAAALPLVDGYAGTLHFLALHIEPQMLEVVAVVHVPDSRIETIRPSHM